MEGMRNKRKIVLTDCDFSNPEHSAAVVKLINAYIQDPMGGGKPLNRKQQGLLIDGLTTRLNLILKLALYENEFVGLILCFENFSTFRVQTMINIHDVIVHKKYRNLGIGKTLLNGIVAEAKKRKCCKITLEVRKDNPIAKTFYRHFGFGNCNPEMLFWVNALN